MLFLFENWFFGNCGVTPRVVRQEWLPLQGKFVCVCVRLGVDVLFFKMPRVLYANVNFSLTLMYQCKMFYFVPGGIKSAYRTSSCLRLKGSSMPFRRRRPCQHSFRIKWWVPTSFHHNSLQPKFGDDWRAFFERDSGWFQVFTRTDCISTLSSFIVIFQPNNPF